MLTPTRFESPPSCIERGWRLVQITQAIPEISGLVATYEDAVTSFEGLYNGWRLARRKASVALAAQHEAEAALDEEIRGVGLVLIKIARGRRDSLTFCNYFPRGIAKTLRLGADQSLQIAAGLAASMANETNPEILVHCGGAVGRTSEPGSEVLGPAGRGKSAERGKGDPRGGEVRVAQRHDDVLLRGAVPVPRPPGVGRVDVQGPRKPAEG